MTQQPFSAATNKLAYAQVFAGTDHPRPERARPGWLRRLRTR